MLFPLPCQCRNKQTRPTCLSSSSVSKLPKHMKHWTPCVISIFVLCNRDEFGFHNFLYSIVLFHLVCGWTLMCCSADAVFRQCTREAGTNCCLVLDCWDWEKLKLLCICNSSYNSVRLGWCNAPPLSFIGLTLFAMIPSSDGNNWNSTVCWQAGDQKKLYILVWANQKIIKTK